MTVGASGHTNSPHPSSREGRLSTARWSSGVLLSDVPGPSKKIAAFECSAKAADELRNKLSDVRASYDRQTDSFGGGFNYLTKADEIDSAQGNFIKAFQRELSHLLSAEFTSFYDSYYLGVPWYARPSFLIVVSFVSLMGCLICLVFLP